MALDFARRGEEVIGVAGQQPLRGQPFEAVRIDLRDDDAVEHLLDRTGCEAVVHCAAMTDVDACETAPDAAWRLNARLPGRLAAAAAGRGLRLIHVSTDAVFDGVRGGYAEGDAPSPVNVYGRTKLAGERAVERAHPDAVIVRVNFFGWSATGRRSLAEWFFDHLRRGIRVGGFTDVRISPLLANDVANVLAALLARDVTGVFHAGAAHGLSKFEFGRLVAREFGFDEDLVTASVSAAAGLAAPRPRNLCLRSDRLARVLGVRPAAVEGGLTRLHELHRNGYRELLSGMLAPR